MLCQPVPNPNSKMEVQMFVCWCVHLAVVTETRVFYYTTLQLTNPQNCVYVHACVCVRAHVCK